MNKRFHSIQVTMAIAFSLVSVSIIVAAILISFSVTEETARLSSQQYTKQLIRQISNNISAYIDYMIGISTFVQSDKDIQEYLLASHLENKIKAAQRAQEVLKTFIRSRKDISLVAIFNFYGDSLFHDPTFIQNPFRPPSMQSWFTAAIQAQGNSIISSSHVQNIILNRYRWVISLSRLIYKTSTNEKIGVLLVDLNYDVINQICSSIQLGKRGYVFIIDKNGEIVYHPQQQLIYGNLKKENINQIIHSSQNYIAADNVEDDKFYSIETMPVIGWKVVGVNYRNELVENRDKIRQTYFFWGLTFFSISIVLSLFIAQQISRPIRQLRNSMRQVELGNFSVRADIQSTNEIGELGRDFNIMVAEISKLLQSITEQQELKRKSELKALQMQINPHFLYNTLDSIIWMAEGGKQQEVIAMSSALARLFRLSISKGKEIIDIGSEVEHVRNYLTIQKIRYKDKLDYRIEIPEDLKPYKTVKIILQPLVENAIYHGIKNKEGTGLIIIGGRKTQTGIELYVEDDGVGMNEETMRLLQERIKGNKEVLPSDSSLLHSGLGVHNVDERIKLYFGPDYGLVYESIEDMGTTVRIHLPAIEGALEE
ncbi:cache domain-containing sensor histidine kinase [Gracilinema caldarium]|uniref:Multi-sensor signal transduction histidine kinase n=1 Tax=Gracilinema caldarium (strain ATCC 51460 / DSM 7334 / H1) TaxID=744872 RepID=F8F0Y4_GRAC1|nr:sensor histidine kinase [Gracilinema caldarium]AEJ20270.1 multi-sensor signal transduction histidine kinase [Gracilinema caldarium DSM 7334]